MKLYFDKNKLPLNKELTPSEMANIFSPNSISIDTEGRTFNRCACVVARLARKVNGIIEIRNNVFIRIY